MFSCNNCKHLLWNEICPLKIYILNSQSLVPQNVTIVGDRHSKKWFHWNEVDRVVPLSNMLLLLSHFSHARLCATPWMAVHQVLPSPGLSRQEHWSGLPFSFSNAWKWKVKVKLLSCVWLLATPWTAAHQAPLSMGFSRQETGVGCHRLLRYPTWSMSL